DAGLDRKAGPRRDTALVVGLEIVHIGAIAVHFLSDGVAGAMGEVLGEAGIADDAAAGVVHFEAAQAVSGRHAFFHPLYSGVPRAGDDFENTAHVVGRVVAAEMGPGDVVIDCAGLVELGPHVEQEKIALTDRRGDRVGRLVVGIGGVRIRADDGAVIGEQASL